MFLFKTNITSSNIKLFTNIFVYTFQVLLPDKEKVKLASTEKRKADDGEQIKDLKKVNTIFL